MTTAQLVQRNLTYFWRTNLAVIAGVAIAVSVLAGALLVGDSVRGSLRDLFLQRLGNTDYVVTSAGFFREQLAADIQQRADFSRAGFEAAAPLIALEGSITHEASKRLATNIKVYGVDERFWAFHSQQNRGPLNRDILVSDALSKELGSHAGDALLLRVQKPSEIPVESLHSKKDDLGRTLRLTVREALSSADLGEFSVQPQQSETRAAFVPLRLLQRELELEDKANLILLSEVSRSGNSTTQGARTELISPILKDADLPEDYGLKLRALDEQKALSVESSAGFISQGLAERIESGANPPGASRYLSYLINSIRRDDGREIPYSTATAVHRELLEVMQHDESGHPAGCDDSDVQESAASTGHLPPIVLNEWAGSDLQVNPGDRVTLDYYVWLDEGRLATRSAEFRVACIIPIKGLAADRDLVPDYPGITESETLGDWDPPFPIDLKRIRPQDEAYWKKYRTTPKGFIPLEVGQALWQSRFGKLTSLRIYPTQGQAVSEAKQSLERSLREAIDPLDAGFSILPVRAQGLEASRGATNFGEYFLYFSFFLVISALLLTALFFKLGVEQRLREIGLLQAVGFPAFRVRKLFLVEGIVLAVVGSLLGLAGAVAYGELMMTGLSTWWVEAVGTRMLNLHIAPLSLLLGAVGGVLAALICIVWTLRQLGRASSRSLLMGTRGDASSHLRVSASPGLRVPSPRLLIAFVLTTLGLALLLLATSQVIGQTVGFFGGGVLLLTALFCYQSAWLRTGRGKAINGTGWWPVARLGFRNATNRPGRSVLCIALIASAAFIIVSVDAFRRGSGVEALERKSGNGGFPLLAESLLPLVHDLNTPEGREALNLTDSDPSSPLSKVTFSRFRVRPGDDASCLNLYQPRNPRIITPMTEFIEANRFVFANSIASTEEEKANPWRLLNREFSDGAIPIIGDANSMTYVMHLKVGEDFVLNREAGPIRLRLVGTLSDSVFQSELLMGEKNFLRLFPEQEGFRFFLIDTAPGNDSTSVATALEERLGDFGFDVVSTNERLASFHRVENTYLSTFQMLGGLGLLLGTLGLAAVLLRNVLERRRELALLRAVGYNPSHFMLMIISENAFLLFSGLVTGTLCALLAIAPVFFERGGRLPNISLGLLLLAVLISGLVASLLATWAALRSPLLPALRAE